MGAAAALAVTLVVGGALGGCGSHPVPAPQAKPEGSLTLALIGRPATLDPITVSDGTGYALDSLIFDGLVRIAPNLSPRPDLASSWRVSPDGLLYTFHLDRRARWQDGKPVTPADVAFSLRAYRDPANGSAVAQELAVIKAVRTIGSDVVQVQLRRPFAPFLVQIATLPVLPSHLLSHVAPGRPFLAQSALGAQPVGTGPFKLQRLTASGALLAANPAYFLGRPRIKDVHVVFSPSATAALQDLRHGKADYAPVPGLDAAAVATWPGVTLRRTVALQYASIVWNVDLPPFSSAPVRRALYFAVDRGRIVKAALGGYGTIADGPIPPDSWAYDQSLGHRPYDPRKALALLAAQGFKPVHGVLRGPQGQPVRLTILTSGAVPTRDVALGLVARDLTAIGVQVTVRSESFTKYLNDFIAGNFQAAFVERGVSADPDVTAYFGSPSINSSGENAGLYQNATVDRALVAERGSVDQSARSTAVRQMEQAMAVDPPALFLYFPDDVVALSRHFGQFAIAPTGAFWNAQNWRRQGP